MSRFMSVAGVKVAELAARTADDGRLSRGRALFRKGAVVDLTVTAGSLIASVRGSEGNHYATTIGTTPAPAGVSREVGHAVDQGRTLDSLLDGGADICPREIDLGFSCECADWEEPCKHVVATLLAFADRVDLDPDELLVWRSIEPVEPEPSTAAPRETPTWRQRAAKRDLEQTPGQNEPEEEPELLPTQKPERAPLQRSEQEAESFSLSDDDRRQRLSDLKALLGNTAMQPSSDRARSGTPEAPEPTVSAELLEFLASPNGIELPDVGALSTPAPLFAELQLGPLAELGPELADALAAIAALLGTAHTSPTDST